MRVAPARWFGIVIETDDFSEYGGLDGDVCTDLKPSLGGEVKRVWLRISKYRGQMQEAVNKVRRKNLEVERITILGGVVQAHPPAEYHWRCPFCYPDNELALGGIIDASV